MSLFRSVNTISGVGEGSIKDNEWRSVVSRPAWRHCRLWLKATAVLHESLHSCHKRHTEYTNQCTWTNNKGILMHSSINLFQEILRLFTSNGLLTSIFGVHGWQTTKSKTIVWKVLLVHTVHHLKLWESSSGLELIKRVAKNLMQVALCFCCSNVMFWVLENTGTDKPHLVPNS